MALKKSAWSRAERQEAEPAARRAGKAEINEQLAELPKVCARCKRPVMGKGQLVVPPKVEIELGIAETRIYHSLCHGAERNEGKL